VGYKNAAVATKLFCSQFRPDYMILLGFCGSADPRADVGTLVVANSVQYKNDNHKPLDSPELKDVTKSLKQSSIKHLIGGIQTFDHPVLSNKVVKQSAIAVDMEAYAVVSKAAEQNVPVLVVKAVSDMLPSTQPWVLPELRLQMRIYRNFITAKKGLNNFYKFWLQTLLNT